MNDRESPDTEATSVRIEPDGESPPDRASFFPLFPATVGPCPQCRRSVVQAFGEGPEQRFWFHLAPRAGPCLLHREGPRAWQ